MKTKLRILGLLIGLCSTIATTAVFGQTTYVWTNQTPLLLVSGDMNQATNWTPNGIPRPDVTDGTSYGDEMQFDGRTTGPLAVTQNGGIQVNGGGSTQPYGLRIHLTSNQTSSVTIQSSAAISAGMRVNYFAIDAGSGGLILGGHNGNGYNIIAGVLNGQVLGFTNNSSTPSEITEGLRWTVGGAGPHPFIFTGTGDWIVNDHLRTFNGNPALIQEFGSGTMTWTGTNNANSVCVVPIGNPITIGGGTMIWKTSDLVGGSAGNPNIVHNGTLFKYDAADGGTCLVLGVISGTGPIQMNAGALNLSGQNTTTGNWSLTGGTLIAGATENTGVNGPLGLGGAISFGGGTLQYSANNAFDYSPRFSTSPGQAISIDTAGQSVTFATGLSSSGGTLTKTNSGTLTLAGTSSYSGLTTISGGKLVFQGSKTGSGDITVADTAALGVVENGSQTTPATLTLGTSGGATLEFNNVTNTATAPLAPATLSSAGTVTVNINSGTFTVGQSYPLLSWTTGSPPAVSLKLLNGFAGNLSTNGNTIRLNVTGTPFYLWTGLNGGSWDLITPNNWRQNGSPTIFSNGIPTVLDDTATGTTAVTVNALVQPSALTISNSSKTYSITSSVGKNIGGSTGLTKSGSGTLTLSGGANTYTGVTRISGGVLSVSTLANSGSASDIGAGGSAADLVLDGGTLRYTGFPTSIDRLFTLGPGGGAIAAENVGILTLNNSGSVVVIGSGPRVLTLTGENQADNVFAASVSDSPFGGATSLTKSGFGNWVLTGSNTYSGTTTIAAGVLVLQGNGSLGSGNIIDDGALVFRGGGTFTVTGTISGSGDVIKVENGTVILPGNNTYARVTEIYGGTMIINGNNASASTTVFGGALGGIGTLAGPVTLNAGTTLVPGVSAASIGTLTINSSLTVGGNLAVEVNKSLLQSNDFVAVSSTLTNGGTGTLTVTNLGPALVVGDKFMLLSKPMQNGAAVTVTGAGASWANNLAVDGSISVIAPPTLNFTQTGNGIQFSWTGSFKLQAQTNSVSVGLGTNWVNYPGGISGVTVPIVVMNGTVFFRLVSTP